MIAETPEEAQILINLLNVAVMAKGFEVAESALVFAKRAQAIIDMQPKAGVIDAEVVA